MGRRKVDDIPSPMIKYQEDVQNAEADRWDRKKVNGPGDVDVIPQERQPSG